MKPAASLFALKLYQTIKIPSKWLQTLPSVFNHGAQIFHASMCNSSSCVASKFHLVSGWCTRNIQALIKDLKHQLHLCTDLRPTDLGCRILKQQIYIFTNFSPLPNLACDLRFLLVIFKIKLSWSNPGTHVCSSGVTNVDTLEK